MRLWFLVSFTVIGCGRAEGDAPKEIGPADAVSGSRLKMRRLATASGLSTFQGWYDSELEVPCTFMTAADGELRCLPDAEAQAYQDSTCTASVALRGSERNGAPYVMESVEHPVEQCWGTGHESQYRVFRLESDRGEIPLYQYIGAECAPTECYGNVHAFDLRVRTEVPPEKFVRARHVVEPRTERVGSHELVADDGAREITQPENLDSGTPCLGPEYGLNRCVPQNVAYADVIPWRGDANCSQVIAHGSALTCPPPDLVFAVTGHFGGACGASGVTLYQLGPQFTGQVYELRDTCTPDTTHPSDFFFELGSEIPASRYAELGTLTLGTGEIRAAVQVAPPNREPLRRADLVNADGDLVRALRLEDGEQHGVTDPVFDMETQPSHEPGTGYVFSDPACTRLSPPQFTDACTGEPKRPITALTDVCTGLTTLYTSKLADTPGGYEITEQGCTPREPIEGEVVLALDRVVDPDTYPVLHEVIE